MNLFELCAESTSAASVPDWLLGCYRRASITFFNGESDRETLVIWLQSRGLTGDLRLSPDRPKLTAREELFEQPPAELLRLADVEGGIAASRFEAQGGGALAGTMRWDAWEAFQLHPKWPEPGLLRRVGDCLVEFAPSGAYVEDWRLQASESGPLVGLALVEERDLERETTLHRGGGLLIAGGHALFVRGRPVPLPPVARLAELVARAPVDRSVVEAIFSFEASYARARPSGEFVVTASTLPWREGEGLLSLDGFRVDSAGLLVQRTREAGCDVERIFRVDTLEPTFHAGKASAATEAARAWLEAESRTLLGKT